MEARRRIAEEKIATNQIEATIEHAVAATEGAALVAGQSCMRVAGGGGQQERSLMQEAPSGMGGLHQGGSGKHCKGLA